MKQTIVLIAFCILAQIAPRQNLQAACDFTSTEDLVITPSGTHNAMAGFTQLYLLTDEDGVILVTSSTGNFGPQAYGSYQVHALNYQDINPPNPLPVLGADVDDFSGGCFDLFTLPSPITVCPVSNLEACENSGQVITIVSTPDFNDGSGFNQAIVVVDTATGNIAAVSMISGVGTATFTTTSVTGDLLAGGYKAYAVNFQNPETLASLGLLAGSPWTGAFGAACAVASTPVVVVVNPPGSCLPVNSVLTACENSGEVISVQTIAYNQNLGYNQAVVIVDTATGLIAAVKSTDSNGLAVFSTITGSGDLNAGHYDVYALNYENPATLNSLGAIIGNSWPLAFGGACADTIGPVRAVVTVPGSCITLLDIEILSFEGEAQGGYDRLSWDFRKDQSNLATDLLHAGEDLNFSPIYSLSDVPFDEIAGQYINYEAFSGENYYRLRFLSVNGEVSFSNIVELEQSRSDLTMLISPNPTSDAPVNLLFGGDFSGELEVRVVDMMGRIVKSKEIQLDGRGKSLVLLESPSELPAGIYLVQAHSNGNRFPTKRLIIQ